MPGVVVETAQQGQQGSKARKPTKNEQRRAKKKAQKLESTTNPSNDVETTTTTSTNTNTNSKPGAQPVASAVEDTTEDVTDTAFEPAKDDPLYSQFAQVFAKFSEDQAEQDNTAEKEPVKPEVFFNDEDNVQDEEEEAETKQKLSKKARKKATKLSVAELKTIVSKPEAVEWTDVSAVDPKLLVNIKSTRNVVPVPQHWQLKREYLSSKRGIEKQNFRLPQFIAETGISELRQSAQDQANDGSLKQKARERVNPTLGKFDIDYQKLFEAFFRRQTKPNLTRFGDVYYEGKELEADLKHLRPGELSDELREALNMPLGAPPPWLINMQKFGPPPSYPAIKVPGVNAPLPYGARWGLVSGDWGKPPLLDDGTPRWGGTLVSGTDATTRGQAQAGTEPVVPRTLWGEMQVMEEEEEEEDEDDEDEEGEDDEDGDGPSVNPEQIGKDEDVGGNGLETPFHGTATETGFAQSGMLSVPEGFDIRKQRRGHETEDDAYPRQAGTVLKERSIRNEGFFGGERAYDISASDGRDDGDRSRKRKVGEEEPHHSGKVDPFDVDSMIAEEREKAKRLKRNQERQGYR